MKKRARNLKRSERVAYWEGHVAQWEKSGLTRSEYGRRKEVHPVVLSRWIKKLRRDDGGEALVMVDTKWMGPEVIMGGVEVVLTNGLKVRVPETINSHALREIVAAVRWL